MKERKEREIQLLTFFPGLLARVITFSTLRVKNNETTAVVAPPLPPGFLFIYSL